MRSAVISAALFSCVMIGLATSQGALAEMPDESPTGSGPTQSEEGAGGHAIMDHGGMHHSSSDAAPMPGENATSQQTPSPNLTEANRRMHEAMAIEPTGDPDVDFVRGMIAHHEGAIDMARIVLKDGRDPEIRALAEEIVAAQDREIDLMREWLRAKNLAER